MDIEAQQALIYTQHITAKITKEAERRISEIKMLWLQSLVPGDTVMAQGRQCIITTISPDRSAFELIDGDGPGDRVAPLDGEAFEPASIHPWVSRQNTTWNIIKAEPPPPTCAHLPSA